MTQYRSRVNTQRSMTLYQHSDDGTRAGNRGCGRFTRTVKVKRCAREEAAAFGYPRERMC
jgi:hypothetical protein